MLMANRPSSGRGLGTKSDQTIEPQALVRQWTEGMRLEALANLAHELRTPLQVLLGYLDILRDEWAEKFDPEPRAMLERMNSNLHDLTQTVDNIMEFVNVGGWCHRACGGGRVDQQPGE
jgi:signal transduction histidine kinase